MTALMNMYSQPLLNGYEEVPKFLNNGDAAPWMVVKFGGTSIGKFAHLIAENIIPASLHGYRVAVVCSARSGSTKLDGTTNRLLRAAREASKSNIRACHDMVACIQRDHIASAKIYIRNPKILHTLSTDIDEDCRNLDIDLTAAQRLGESPGFVDKIISRGETLSSRFLQALLQDRGVDSAFVDLSEAIDFEAPHELFYHSLADIFAKKVKACGNKIPVITGYFGPVPGGLLNRIGRGYTDLCAALVAVGLSAGELQIWKEVEGVYTADPRKVPTATLLPTLSPAEAAELTFYGSEVIHPFTMEQVIYARIPIRIKNIVNPRGRGTLIKPDEADFLSQSVPGHDPKLFHTRSSSLLKDTKPKRPTAVTVKDKIIVINVHSNKRSLLHDFYQGIFSTLSKWRLSVDLISTSEVHVSLALHSESEVISGGSDDDKKIVDFELSSAIDELKEYGAVDIIDGMAILSLVGKQMKNMVGIAGKMFSVLGENNINIEMISQGASEINISCVIEARDSDRALNILHTNLFTFLD